MLYSYLLKELGEHLKIEDLHPDSNNSCLIKFANGLSIQMEPDAHEEFLLVATKFEPIHASRYRDNVFHEALKANGMPLPRFGIFAYSKKSDCLMLFDRLHMDDLSGTKIFEHLQPFMEKANVWREAISRGEIPSSGAAHTGVFGMTR